MTPEMYDLLNKIADDAVTSLNNDRAFRKLLLASDEKVHSEVAFYLNDKLAMHPDLPYDVHVPFERTERLHRSLTQRGRLARPVR